MARTGQTVKKAANRKKATAKRTASKAAVKKTAAKKRPGKSTANAKSKDLRGGCLCGSLRYQITPLGADVDYCHCRMCQIWSGAPVSAWAQVPAAQFRLIKGTATPYTSSKKGIRYFCSTCGTSVFMTDETGVDVGIMLGTLDDPKALRPTGHGWWSEHVSWLKLEDGLKHWPKDPPYDR